MAEPAIKQKFIIEVDGAGKIKAYTDALKANEKEVESNAKAQSDLSKTLAKSAASIVSVAAAWKLAKTAFDLGELGAQVEVVNRSFEQFASRSGKNAIAAMNDLRKASGGMMNDMLLQQTAMKGMISGIKFDDMIVAMEYVRKYSIATGSDFEQKMQTVMTGLSRGSAEFMDDVGIIVKGTGDVVGNTIDAMREKMGQFADTSEEAATKVNQMKTSWANLTQEIGTALTPAIEELAKGITQVIENWRVFVKEASGKRLEETLASESFQDKIELLTLNLKGAEIQAKSYLDEGLKLREEFRAGAMDAEAYQSELSRIETNYRGAKKSADGFRKSIADLQQQEKQAAQKSAAYTTPRKTSPSSVAKSPQLEEFTFWDIDSEIWLRGRAQEIAQSTHDAYLEKMKDVFSKDAESDFDLGELFNLTAPEKTASFRDTWEERGYIIESFADTAMMAFQGVAETRRRNLEYETAAEIEHANETIKSRKRREKEIAKIEKEARKQKYELALSEWRQSIAQIQLDAAVGMMKVWANPGYPAAIPLTIAIGAQSSVATGIAIANKPRYYYGSKDASGRYSEVGGNSSGDNINANVRSGELIVKAGNDAELAKAALNGDIRTSQSISISAPITISGNADSSVVAMIPKMVERGIVAAIENSKFRNNFNRALV